MGMGMEPATVAEMNQRAQEHAAAMDLDKDGYIVNPTGARLSGYGVNAQGQVVPSNPGALQLSNADFPPAATSVMSVTSPVQRAT